MSELYLDGQYLENHPTWHMEDSAWKAAQIQKILVQNQVPFKTIAEVGCGAGRILDTLSQSIAVPDVAYHGYEISPQAFQLTQEVNNPRVTYHLADPFNELTPSSEPPFDVLLAIDVFEHVPDYLGFLEKCQQAARYKIYHIPLDMHASAVLRDAVIQTRHRSGHLHYFMATTAMATLKETNHQVIDSFYTSGALELFSKHPSFKRAIANVPRWLMSRLNTPLAARLLGGFSLLVLAE